MSFQKITEIIEVKVEGAEAGKQKLEGVDKALDKIDKSSESAARGQDKLDKIADRLGLSMDKLTSAVDRVNKKMGKQTEQTKKTSAGWSRLQKQIITTSNLMQGMGVAMRGVAIAQRMATKPVSLAVSFEKQFALIQTLTDKAGPKLRKGLLDLARQIPFDAGQVAVSAYNAISNGLDPDKVTSFLKAASDSAVGTGGQLTDSVKVLLAAVSAYGRQGETAATIADKMQTTIKAAVINGGQMAEIMGEMTSAAAYGVKFEEMASAVGAMTLIGVKPQLAIIRTNNMLKAITSTSGHAFEAFKKLKVEAGVLGLQKHGLTGILKQLQKATKGQISEISKLSNNKRALDGFIGTLGANFKNYNRVLDANKKSLGAAAKASGIMAKTTQGQISKFKSGMEAVLRKMGESVLPMLNRALSRLEIWLSQNSDAMTRKFKSAATAILDFGKWLIANGKTVIYTMGAIFSGQLLAGFLTQLDMVKAKMATMGAMSFGQSFLQHLRSPGFLGLLLGAAVPVGTALGNWIGSKMAAGITASGVAAMQDMKRRSDELNAIMRTRGYKGGVKGAQANADLLASGKALSLNPRLTKGGTVAIPKDAELATMDKLSAMPISQVQEISQANIAAQRLSQQAAAKALPAATRAAEKAIHEANFAEMKVHEATRSLTKQRVEQLMNMASHWSEQGKNTDNMFVRLHRARERASTLQNRAEGIQGRIDRSSKTIDAINKSVSGLEAAAKKRAAEDARLKKLFSKPGAGTKRGGGGGRDRDAGWKAAQARAKAIAAANKRNMRRLALAQADSLEDREEAEFASLRLRHEFEIEDAKERGVTLLLIKQRQVGEQQKLLDKIVLNAEKKREEQAKARKARDLRLAQVSGDDKAVAELELQAQLDADLKRFRDAGFQTIQLEKAYAKERIRIRKNMAAQQTAIEMQLGANISQSIETTIGAAKQVAEAFGASDDVISGINAAMILSRSAFHTFMGFSELANAASAAAGAGPFGKPNPWKVAAHKMAATSHFASAAVGAVQAGAAMVGAGGGSGSSNYSAAQTPTNASVGQSRSQLAAERDRPSIVFGDIVLADVPALLSRAGSRALGAQIAGDVAQELGRRSNIQGTARISGRAMRNS